MEELVTLDLLVKKSVASEIAQKGLAEIALRRADAKFRTMEKCKVMKSGLSTDDASQQALAAVLKQGIQGPMDKESVSRAIHALKKGMANQITGLTSTTKNMAIQVDGIYQLTGAMSILSYLNVGFSLANLTIDSIGFSVVNKKLDSLRADMQMMANGIDRIENIQKNEKKAKCIMLIGKSINMSALLQDGDEMDLKNMADFIIELRSYVSEMIMNLNDESLNTEMVLEILYSLVPAYTLLFSEYTKRYYFAKQKLPPNYKWFLDLYDELVNANFSVRLFDYFFIDKKMYSKDVIDVLNAQTLLGLNGKVQIEDLIGILQILNTKEDFGKFDEELDAIVHAWVINKASKVVESSPC